MSPSAVIAGEPATKPDAIVYKVAEGKSLTLEIVKPPDWKPEDHRAAILLFHGGSWTSGTTAQFLGQARHFADRGMVSVLVQYRLLDVKGKEPPAICIQDAKSAMRWVYSHAASLGVDRQRIAAGGGSSGGHLAACVALVPGFNDPADDQTIPVRPVALVLFNPVVSFGPNEFAHERMGDEWPRFSPAQHVTAGAPSTLMMVGSIDKILPTLERMRDAMKAVGARCDLLVYEGQGHSFFNRKKAGNLNPYYDQTLQAADDFLVSVGLLAPVKR